MNNVTRFFTFFFLKRFHLAKTVLRTFLFSRRYSRKTCVHVVNGYLETFGKFWRFLTDFKGTICQKKVFRCVYTIHKSPYLKTKSGVRVVVDIFLKIFFLILISFIYKKKYYISNFAIEYLREKEKSRETVFACSYGAKFESFKQKMVKNLMTLSLKQHTVL